MDKIKYTDIEEIIKQVIDNKVEIELELTPDRQTLTVRPWKPFEYTCPYKGET